MSDRTNHLFFHSFMPVLSCRGQRSQIFRQSVSAVITVTLSPTHTFSAFLSLSGCSLTSFLIAPLCLSQAISIKQPPSPPPWRIAVFYLLLMLWQIWVCVCCWRPSHVLCSPCCCCGAVMTVLTMSSFSTPFPHFDFCTIYNASHLAIDLEARSFG